MLMHLLHMPMDVCVIPLCDGNRHLPVLHFGAIVDRIVFGFAKPSRTATLVSMSISHNCPELPSANLSANIHFEILIDASADSRGLSQDTTLTACWVNGPTPTERVMIIHPRIAVFL